MHPLPRRPSLGLRLLSYLWPLSYRVPSPLSGALELNLINGRLRLDSAEANYSYGPLQRVLEEALDRVWQPTWHKVLVLGLGGGCVVESLRRKFGFQGPVEAVEADPVCVRIAFEVYQVAQRYAPLTVHTARAEAFILQTTDRWPCIVMDVFVDRQVPPACLDPEFIRALYTCLLPGGALIFNTILPADTQKVEAALQASGIAYWKERIWGNEVVFLRG
ncbi:MAG: hypothetical protein N2110_09565 [Flavobacteriales bacterium]|nr:hypothetical protein [Flavobacteriales bacterium]